MTSNKSGIRVAVGYTRAGEKSTSIQSHVPLTCGEFETPECVLYLQCVEQRTTTTVTHQQTTETQVKTKAKEEINSTEETSMAPASFSQQSLLVSMSLLLIQPQPISMATVEFELS